MRLIDIEEINPHVLEKDRLILCFGKTCLRAALGLFQTLFQTGAGNAVSAVLNGFFKLGEQILCHRFHSFRSSTDALERRMRNYNGVRRVQGGLSHKTTPIGSGEIFLVRHHNPGQRVRVLKLRRKLTEHMVRNDIHRPLDKTKAALFHAGDNHFQSFPCAHGMSQVDVTGLDNTPNGPLLMIVQLIPQGKAGERQV